MILLVVLFLLTLFAIAGVSLVLYADAEANAARLYRDAAARRQPEVEPELLLAHFLGQLLFDVDDEAGVYSALRGHSLARNLYGLNDDPGAANAVPYNGTGRRRSGVQSFAGLHRDDFELINYTYYPADGFLRDPERMNWAAGQPVRRRPGEARGPYAGGFNVSYTYPDLNNLFLAAADADGRVLLPSFHRPWLFGPLTERANPNWSNREGKYLTLRPREFDQRLNPAVASAFPYPEDDGGDVKNLIGGAGGNDSVWLDLDFPVLTAPDGRKYKPLFAPLILDLDGRVNLNVHGNLRGSDGAGNRTYVSNQGWGPWEVNPGRVLTQGDEWARLLAGVPTWPGRHGRSGQPGPPAPNNLVRLNWRAPSFAQIDLDGCDRAGSSTAALSPVGQGAAGCFPAFPSGYDNGSPLPPSASPFERTDHPMLYNPFRPRSNGALDSAFPPSDLEGLLRPGDTGSEALAGQLLRLCPSNFADPADREGSARRRRRVTTLSVDLDRPGLSPWVWQPSGAYGLDGLFPSGRASPELPADAPHTAPVTEFAPDGRAASIPFGRLDLNRPLPDYPAPGPTGRIRDFPAFLAAQIARQQLAKDLFDRLRRVTGAADPETIALPAAGSPAIADPEWNALRWLAQLAVNIVDFIDADDYLTPFCWTSREIPGHAAEGWVFGTELPRLLINEAYAEYTPGDPEPDASAVRVWVELFNPSRASNPAADTARPLPDHGAVQLEMPESRLDRGDDYAIYQLSLCRPDTAGHLRRPDNVLGTPEPVLFDVDPPSLVYSQSLEGPFQPATVTKFSPDTPLPSPPVPYPPGPTYPGVDPDPRFVAPCEPFGAASGPSGSNRGYYLIGPGSLPTEGVPSPEVPRPTLVSPQLTYPVRGAGAPPRPTVLLQRLACPHLPPQPDWPPPANRPYYNPYVTVDLMKDVPQNAVTSAVADRASSGRRQPYAAYTDDAGAGAAFLNPAQAPATKLSGQPQHTFFQKNTPAEASFDWLVHLDRPLVSPMELLHVSGFRPHELTQQFATVDAGGVRKYSHRAPWFDEGLPAGGPASRRLYRLFEFVQTRGLSAGLTAPATRALNGVTVPPRGGPVTAAIRPAAMRGVTDGSTPWQIRPGDVLVIDEGSLQENVVVTGVTDTDFTAAFVRSHAAGAVIQLTTTGGRVPGRINLNTLWDADADIFLALCDPQPSNRFTAEDVKTVYSRMLALRTPGLRTGGGPGPADRPFLSLATGHYPGAGVESQHPGRGLNDTLLRAADASGAGESPRLFQTPANDPQPGTTHPHVRYELLTKIFNHATVRSNVFAVWLTVGFFEVTDDTVRPAKLGAEIGRAEGRHVRPRLFAVVDRSVLPRNPGPLPGFDPRTAPALVPHFSVID